MSFIALILISVFGLYASWNIGANDVANAVGTSVGSGAFTLGQAVLVAAIFEFCGAFFLGGKVSTTIETGIINLSNFSNTDYICGMMAALLSTSVWLQVASFFGWPVSTTHSIVGAVLGFGLIIGKSTSIFWGTILSIVLSWIISPILGAGIAYLIFSFIRKKVFYKDDPLKATRKLSPYLAFIVCMILSWLIFVGGVVHLPITPIMLLSIVMTLSSFVFVLVYFLMKKLNCKNIKKPKTLDYRLLKRGGETKDLLLVEKVFAYFQMVVACCMALAHGSNDVANAIAPVSAVFKAILPNFSSKDVIILLAFGGAGIILGLATWGWRVIETIGCKITELTPSRGFSAGFGSSVTIVLASKLGFPVSTTHVVVGAVLGVGFARGIKAINLNLVKDIALSWIVTVPAGAVLSMTFFFILRAFFNYLS